MKLLIAGGSGMVGELIILKALEDDSVSKLISLVRKKGKIKHEKLVEIVIENFEDYSSKTDSFKDISAAFFCIGVYTGAVTKEEFRKITVDYAIAFGKILEEHSPESRLCLLSGSGADRTEKSRIMFAKDKGIAENALSKMRLSGFHAFRPAYIYPVKKRKEPNFTYAATRFLYPLVKLFGKNASIKSTELAEGMFKVGMNGFNKEVLENRDILELIAK